MRCSVGHSLFWCQNKCSGWTYGAKNAQCQAPDGERALRHSPRNSSAQEGDESRASPLPSFNSAQSINKPDIIPVYSPFEGTSVYLCIKNIVDSQEGKTHERKKEPHPVVK